MSGSDLVRDEGHWGLELVRDCEIPKVDIIFVHGVAVTPQFAWRYQIKNDGKPAKDDDGNFKVVNWLKDEDMLPSEIKDARILAFNYESKWLRSNAQVRPGSVGQSLMDAIHHERREAAAQTKGNDEPKMRPIVFVGHSFGGLVIEQGLVDAITDGNPCEDVPKCTVAIALLGTPHGGSDMAQVASTVARITEVAGILGGSVSDSTIMDSLRTDSNAFHDMLNKFVAWAGKYNVDVRCFFEEKRTSYGNKAGVLGFVGGTKNELVVTRESAVLLGRVGIGLPADHQRIAKFAGPHDEAYLRVKRQLKAMVEDNLEKGRLRFNPREFKQDNSDIPAVNLECQKALFISWPTTELEQIKRRLGDRTKDTCQWLLAKEEYIKWLDSDRPQVMRLVGSPGMGKSMILTFLIEVLTKRLTVTPEMVLAYHFCDNRNQSSNTATAVIRQILFQLFQQRPKHFHILQKAYDIQGVKLFQDFEKLWQILWEVLQQYPIDYEKNEVFLLIDALDECDEDSRKLLLPKLQKVAADSSLEVRVFFTCRPEDDIESSYFDHDGTIKTLSCHMDVGDIHNDLMLYMDDKIPKLCREKFWEKAEEDMIKDALMEKANGIFLWCSFVIEDIRLVKRKTNIKKCLENLPKDLVAVYKRITNNFAENDRLVAKMVLEIVAGGRRPLKVEELTTTYVLAEDCPLDDKWKENKLPSDECTREHDDVYKTCGRLLFKDEPTNTINLVHQSAKDYLLSEYLAGETRGILDNNENVELSVEERRHNTRMTNVRLNNVFLELIFRYFSLQDFDHLQFRMVFDAEWDIDWECSWWEMEPSPSFMVYCGREWENHAKNAEDHPTGGMGRFINYITYEGEAPLAKGLAEVEKPRTSVINSWLRKVAISGNNKFVEFLLSQGAKRDSADFRGWTAVQLAAKHKRAKVIDLLVKEGANLNAVPPHIDGRTPVQTAAEEGHIEILEQLIELKANIDYPPAKINGRTALQAAAEKGLGETVSFLVKANANPDVEGAEVSGVTALLAAAGSGGEWQMGKNIHRTIKQRSRLPGSAEIDTQKIAEEDQQDRDQRILEEQNHERVVKILVNAGAKLIPNKFNWSALHAAVERESDDMVDMMLRKFTSEECHIRGDHDGTPLHSAKAKANEELAKKFEAKGCKDDYCLYSKLDLDAMMKYIRAVLTRLMIRSNTERFFFIQSYIPIYHVIYSYCAEGADDMNDKPPVEQGGRRGELVYRDVDAWLKSYVMWNQKFINDTPANNDFLTVYLREWKLFKRGAYYVGRMLRYLTRHWVKHQREELKHLDVKDIADLFFHRWRTGMTSQVRDKIKKGMKLIEADHRVKKHNDQRVKDAINESLEIVQPRTWLDFKDLFQSAEEYFDNLGTLNWNGDDKFEVELRHLSDEFEVESQLWVQQGKDVEAEKRKVLSKTASCWRNEGAMDLFLNNLEPLFLAQYSGGKTEEIKQHVNDLWDILRDRPEEAQRRRAAENEKRTQANADIDLSNGVAREADGDVTMMNGPNGIRQAPVEETAA